MFFVHRQFPANKRRRGDTSGDEETAAKSRRILDDIGIFYILYIVILDRM